MAHVVPVLAFTGALASSALALRRNALISKLMLIPFFALGVSAFTNVPSITSSLSLRSVMGLFIIIWQFHVSALVLFNRRGNDEVLAWKQVCKAIFDFRGISEKATAKAKDPAKQEKQSSSLFLGQQSARLAVFSSMWYLYETVGSEWMGRLLVRAWTSKGIEEVPLCLAMDTVLVADFVVSTYLVDNAFHASFAIFYVSIVGLDSPGEWPVLFGDVRAAHSVRGFWGGFWHRLVARPYMAWSSKLLKLVGIDSRSNAGKAAAPYLIFLISGVAHALSNHMVGLQCGLWADIAWFVSQAAAMTLEDLTQRPLERLGGFKLRPERVKLLGYVWTWGFMLATIPRMQYAHIMCASS